MAVTLTVIKRGLAGNQRRVIVDVTGPASYTTGGETLTAAQQAYLMPETSANVTTADFTTVSFVEAETMAGTTPAFLSGGINKTANKFFFTTAGAETASLANLSAQKVRVNILYGGSTGA